MDDFEPIVHELDGRTIRVVAVSDVHLGAKECDLEAFRSFLRRVEREPDTFVVTAGDLFDNAVSAPASLFRSDPEGAMELAVSLFKPIADSGKILGMATGNHEARSIRLADVDPTEVLAYRLGIHDVYRQDMAFVRIRLSRNCVYDVYSLLLMHGASKTRKDRFHVEGVDAFISGHTHDPYVAKPARLVFTEKGNVRVKPTIHLTACSWLKYGGYGAAKMYPPKACSDPQELELEFTNSNNKAGRARVIW